MTATATSRTFATPTFHVVVIVLAALTAIRLAGLHVSTVDLFFDEAQYWAWSRELAFGYFSKPPLLAWIIAASDPVCGSTESCVRAASPVIHFGTCLLIYLIANDLYGRDVAAWSALVFALSTGLAFSSRIISTDVPLVFFWAAALLSYLKLLRAPDWRWAATLGVSIGFGMLAKYAMIYFVLCAICAALVDRDARALLMRRQTWIALVIAAIILSPNVYWNAVNDFATVKHTGDNIAGGGLRFRPLAALEFVASQFGVIGPLVFGAFLIILVQAARMPVRREDRLMLAFALPPLALVTALAFFRHANANWAAAALLSVTILAVAWWVRSGMTRWLQATLAIGLIVQLALLIGDAYAYRISLPVLGQKADVYQRTLGWRPLGSEMARLARANNAKTVVAEGRSEVAALIYYLRNEPVRALAWPLSATPQHHFDLTRALGNSAEEPILFVSYCGNAGRLKKFYSNVTPLGSVTASTGATSSRQYNVMRMERRHSAIGPIGPCS